MDSIQNIKDKIKSCISCSEDRCPAIRERLCQHVISHHSSFRPPVTKKHTSSEEKSVETFIPTKPVSLTYLDKQTSTTDLILDALENDKTVTNYREALLPEVLDWAEGLPKYSNTNAENLKQLMVKELIENINRLSPEIFEDIYDLKLSREISQFLNSLPTSSETTKLGYNFENLKETLNHRILKINNNIINKPNVLNNNIKHAIGENESKVKDSATNTLLSFDYNEKNTKAYHNDSNIMTRYFRDDCSPYNQPCLRNQNLKEKQYVDAQIQHSSSNITSYYGNIYGQPNIKINRQPKAAIEDDIFKQNIYNWLSQIVQDNRYIELSDKLVLTDVLINRLRPLLNSKIQSIKYKLLLKGEIMNFLNDYFNDTIALNSAYCNKLVEELAIKLLIEKVNVQRLPKIHNTYIQHSYNSADQIIRMNIEPECYFKPIFHRVVADTLQNIMHTNGIVEDISELILNNMNKIRMGNNGDLKSDLFTLLKSSTNLDRCSLKDVNNSIVEEITSIIFSDISDDICFKGFNDTSWSNIIQVYKSEHELGNISNQSSTCLSKPKLNTVSDSVMGSALNKKNVNGNNTKEITYREKLITAIESWMNILPKKHDNISDRKSKEATVNSLVIDIVDQVKLEQLKPNISTEKEKYITFFINRWLNRFEFFENIYSAKPYVEQLVKIIREIPIPVLIKSHETTQRAKRSSKNLEHSLNPQQHSKPERDFKILEDDILSLTNREPSKIFLNKSKRYRDKVTHEFVQHVQGVIVKKCYTKELMKAIDQYLGKLIKIDEKQKLKFLKEKLTKIIVNLVDNGKTVIVRQMNTGNIKLKHNEKESQDCCKMCLAYIYDLKDILKQIITEYIENSREVNSSLLKIVYSQILIMELDKLFTLVSKGMKNNLNDGMQHETLSFENLSNELKYITLISDWLKDVPLDTSINRTENNGRIELINSLSKQLSGIKECKLNLSCGTSSTFFLLPIINQCIDQLPIPSDYKTAMSTKSQALANKIEESFFSPLYCQYINKTKSKSINHARPEQKLSIFIEGYIREYIDQLKDDDLKLEAISLRLSREVFKNENNYHTKPCLLQSCFQSNLLKEETVKLVSKLSYAKEIFTWLDSLPFLSLTDEASTDVMVIMIINLADKINESLQFRNINNNSRQADTDLNDFVKEWISELPIDSTEENDLSIIGQQLLRRIKQMNEIPEFLIQASSENISQDHSTSNIDTQCLPTYNEEIDKSKKRKNPGTAIVDAIDKWCLNLPLHMDDNSKESDLKGNVATKLFQKVCELNLNPACFNDNIMFQELFSAEIDVQLQNLPLDTKVQNLKQTLKAQLLENILRNKIQIKQMSSGLEYKHDLEKAIDLLMPYPLKFYFKDNPGYELYKDRLVTIFILENFEYCHDTKKLTYIKQIKEEIDKYFQEIKNDNSCDLTKDQFYNELYSQLFSVSVPNNNMSQEIEEIKTKCEIIKWFETLPQRPATNVGEILERDQILTALAKRLLEIEQYDDNSDKLMHNAIRKWLLKLPLLPDQENNVDIFANNLQEILKSTFETRRYKPQHQDTTEEKTVIDTEKIRDILGNNRIPSPGMKEQTWQSIPPYESTACCYVLPSSRKRPGEIILDIVGMWCQQLPLSTNIGQDNIKNIKDNLLVNIVMKISELNINPVALNDDYLYDTLLDDALEHLLSALPGSIEFIRTKNMRKNELKNTIKSVKALIKEEKARYDYRQQLMNTVENILKEPNEIPENKYTLKTLKEDIVDNFIIYNFCKIHKEDEEIYKTMVRNAVQNYFREVVENSHNTMTFSSLMIENQLLCELAKVPVPADAKVIDEIEEILIKFEISDFLSDFSLSNDEKKLLVKNKVLCILSKRLADIIRNEFSLENEKKIRNEILKYLNKIDENFDTDKIESFIKKVQKIRPLRISHLSSKSYTVSSNCKVCNQNSCIKDDQWSSPAPQEYDSKYKTLDSKEFGLNNTEVQKPQMNNGHDPRTRRFGISYENFKKGAEFTKQNPHESNSKTMSFSYIMPNENTRSDSSNHSDTIKYMSQGHETLKPTPTPLANPDTTELQGRESLFPETLKPVPHIIMSKDRISYSTKNSEQQATLSWTPKISDDIKPQFSIPPYINEIDEIKSRQQPGLPIALEMPHYSHVCTNAELPSTSKSRISRLSPCSQSQSMQNVSIKRPIGTCPRRLIQESHKNVSVPFDYFQEAPSFNDNATKFPNIQMKQQISIPCENSEETKPYALPSQSISASSKIREPQIPVPDSYVSRPCRRPSITIYNPTGVKDKCACFNKKENQYHRSICNKHLRKNCKVCTNVDQTQCSMTPCRYPGIYYP